MSDDVVAEEEGKYILFKVGKAYNSRTLGNALNKALRGSPLNSEEKLSFILIKVALEALNDKRGK